METYSPRIASEFVYRQPFVDGPPGVVYRQPPSYSPEYDYVCASDPTAQQVVGPTQLVQPPLYRGMDAWEQRRVHVDPAPHEQYQMHGRVPPQTWTDMAKEWISSLSPRETQPQAELPQQYYAEEPHPSRIEPMVYVQPPKLVQAPRMVPAAAPQPVIAVAAPQPILIPLESEIVCRGHASDRTELCFGCSIPPRQLKYDIVREEVGGCFGICRGQRFKAVCRKCRAVMPPCQQCGKQSVIRHP